MVKIRLCSEDPDEVEAAVALMEALFPQMRFSAARLGGNPKYANDPKYFSYGEPRIRDKKPVKVDFESVARKVKGISTTEAPKKRIK